MKGPKTVAAGDRAQRGQTSFARAAEPAQFQLWKRDTGNEPSLLEQIAGISNAKKATLIIDSNEADKMQIWPAKLDADAVKPEAGIELSDASGTGRAADRD